MSDTPRITAADLKKRMDAGEDFIIIDTRNPQAWGESDTKARRAIRMPLDEADRHLAHIPKTKPVVTYCT